MRVGIFCRSRPALHRQGITSLAAAARRTGGLCLTVTMFGQIAYLLTRAPWCFELATLFLIIGILTLLPTLAWSRRLYVGIGAALIWTVIVIDPQGADALGSGIERSVSIAAFFIALQTISSVAARAGALVEAGNFIAAQPPGRRYLALTLSGHLFGLVMMYGAISLLGRLVSARAVADVNSRDLRRMLLAIQRGFVSILPWSPLSIPIAVTLVIVPGATWAPAAGFCLFSTGVILGAGWMIDRLHEPGSPPAQAHVTGVRSDWAHHLAPLALLLVTILFTVFSVSQLANLQITAAVTIVLPVIALAWSLVMSLRTGAGHAMPADFVLKEVPAVSGELTLVVMAPMIGSFGAELMQPALSGLGPYLEALPSAALLLMVFWLFPVTGQLGMHPLLCVSFFAPLLIDGALAGIEPALLVTAITSGWALSGATSPFTASVLLIAKLGGVGTLRAGPIWNGWFTIVAGSLLSAWLVLLARIV